MHRLYLSIIAVLIGFVVYLTVGEKANGPDPISDADYPPRSIAVLRFIGLGEEAEVKAMADAFSEEVINAMVSAEGILVAARTSSFAVTDVNQAARKLGVRYLLEGSLRYEDSRVRVTAQLVDGETEAHLWSQTYRRDDADISGLSSEVARAVVDTVRRGRE